MAHFLWIFAAYRGLVCHRVGRDSSISLLLCWVREKITVNWKQCWLCCQDLTSAKQTSMMNWGRLLLFSPNHNQHQQKKEKKKVYFLHVCSSVVQGYLTSNWDNIITIQLPCHTHCKQEFVVLLHMHISRLYFIWMCFLLQTSLTLSRKILF